MRSKHVHTTDTKKEKEWKNEENNVKRFSFHSIFSFDSVSLLSVLFGEQMHIFVIVVSDERQ